MRTVIKDKLYNYFVRKNGRVWYEYERYVRENMVEHRLHRFRHLRVLIKLNWFYRVKKGNTPYLYWDTPVEPNNKVSNNSLVNAACLDKTNGNTKPFDLECNKPIKRKNQLILWKIYGDMRLFHLIFLIR